jgi:hypothetical protein
MQSKQISASLLSILSKQFFTYLKDDAIKTNYCITIFKTILNMFQTQCNQAKFLHHFLQCLQGTVLD